MLFKKRIWMRVALFVYACLSGHYTFAVDSIDFQEKFQNFISQSELHIPKEEYLDLYNVFYNVFLKDLSPLEKPSLIIFAGGPGSGKTTARREYMKDFQNFHLHDIDEVFIRLKSYQEDLKTLTALEAFDNNWQVARKVSNQLVQFAFQNKFNVIYDRTCGSEGSLADLRDAVNIKGYSVTMSAFYVGEKMALERVVNREREEGRAVEPKLVTEYTQRFSGLFKDYLSFIPDVTLFCYGELCFEKKTGKENIFNEKAYEEFLNYSERTLSETP